MSDPSPVAFESFGFHPDILRAIEELHFEACTPIQARSFPHTLHGEDLAGQAQTGTGKTAAFLLTIYQRLLEEPGDSARGPQAIIVAPTRELASQIAADAALLGKYLPFRSALIHGGVGYGGQRRALAAHADLVIGTPGRLIDLIRSRELRLGNIRFAVIDEADRMFDMGFLKDLRYILRRLPPIDRRQTMLFSATLSIRVLELAYEHMNSPVLITVDPERVTVEGVDQTLFHVASREKLPLLLGLLKTEEWTRVLIFCNTKAEVRRLSKSLSLNGFRATGLSSDITQRKRQQIVNAFKRGEIPILVATDVASRGLHVEDISHVINYDLPQNPEDYVHRIGRTARAGRRGKAITFACEIYVLALDAIEHFLGEKIPERWVDDSLLVEPRREPPRRSSGRGRRSGRRPPRTRRGPAPRRS